MSLVNDLVKHYRELIERGELAPQEVPGAKMMAHEWCVGVGSAEKARRMLMDAGLCYGNLRHTMPLGPITRHDWARFLKFVDQPDENGCLKWTGTVKGQGYGSFSLNGYTVAAHRVAYEHVVGLIPDGLELDHVWERGCRSIRCVNVEHLEPVTQAENIRRSYASRARASD